MYLNHISQQAQQQQQQQHQVLAAQQAALFGTAASSPNELSLEVPQGPSISGHQQSASISNGYVTSASSGATTIGGLLAPGNPRGQHNRAVSLPVLAPGFENDGTGPGSLQGSTGGGDGERRGHQYQASFGGMGAGFGLAIQGGLNGWVEEEVAN
ncbi:hypothetical protein VTK73DRAFT_3442 [Phialemonium thermophilum]|uniref:Uncharacterized protein n=1 Tax=Phialemonium thermophilum TaxID=223376 RepID=A0ABR3VJ91_9PEZI